MIESFSGYVYIGYIYDRYLDGVFQDINEDIKGDVLIRKLFSSLVP